MNFNLVSSFIWFFFLALNHHVSNAKDSAAELNPNGVFFGHQAVYCRANNAFMSGIIEVHVHRDHSQLVFRSPNGPILLADMTTNSIQELPSLDLNLERMEIRASGPGVEYAAGLDKTKLILNKRNDKLTLQVQMLLGPVLDNHVAGQETQLLVGGRASCAYELSEIQK